MPDVPPEVAIKATIRPGSVYYFRHESFIYSEDPHYFIVINLDPLSEKVILLVCSTTRPYNVQQRRLNCPSKTLVEVTPAQYPDFTLTSIIDCNNVIDTETIDSLINRLANKELVMKTEMAIELVEQFREGVLASPLVTGRIKAQLRGKSDLSNK
jgi:hypothetical protein